MNPTPIKELFNNLKDKANPVVFLDVTFDKNINVHRLYFELFKHVTPLTAENFRQFCTGEFKESNIKQPCVYKNTSFTRLVNNMFIQGGDFVNNDGTGEVSIYGKVFNDENFILLHEDIGYLSMANSGPNTNGCQFFITLGNCMELDGENVVFGKAADDYTIEVLKKINEIKSDFSTEEPITPITILDCGQM